MLNDNPCFAGVRKSSILGGSGSKSEQQLLMNKFSHPYSVSIHWFHHLCRLLILLLSQHKCDRTHRGVPGHTTWCSAKQSSSDSAAPQYETASIHSTVWVPVFTLCFHMLNPAVHTSQFTPAKYNRVRKG